MTIIEAMVADLKEKGIVTGLKGWKGNRTYIQVAGYNHGYAGCRSHQLYWDHQSQQLVNQYGKGTRPDAFDESIDAVVSAFVGID